MRSLTLTLSLSALLTACAASVQDTANPASDPEALETTYAPEQQGDLPAHGLGPVEGEDIYSVQDVPTVTLEKALATALAHGVDPSRVTYQDSVPFDTTGEGDFELVFGFTEVLTDGSLRETYIDPYDASFLAQEAPHAGLEARIREIGADDVRSWGTTPETYDSFPWGWALPFKSATGVMTQGYGGSYSHTSSSIWYSTDWDPGACGLSVVSPTSGWVVYRGYSSSYGNQVIVAGNCASGTCTYGGGGNRYTYRIGHLQSTSSVVPGWWVAKGTEVGKMGTTGYSTGCHIHMTAYRGTVSGSTITGESLPINKWPSTADSICSSKFTGYNFGDSTYDYVTVGSSGC